MSIQKTTYGEIPHLDRFPRSTFKLQPDHATRFWRDHIEGMQALIHKALDETHGSSIGIAGAGRCYDIDLQKLVNRKTVNEVHIIDLNESDVDGALKRTKDPIEKVQFTNMDITLVFAEFLRKLSALPVSAIDTSAKSTDRMGAVIAPFISLFKECLERRQIPQELQKKFDVTVSDAILSQLVFVFCEYVFHYLDSHKLLRRNGITEENVNVFRKQLQYSAYELLLPDHIGVLRAMTRDQGRVVLVAENVNLQFVMLPRGARSREVGWSVERQFQGRNILKQDDEDPVLRNGERIDDAVRRQVSGVEIKETSSWRWYRVPPELHEGLGTNVHDVIGVSLIN